MCSQEEWKLMLPKMQTFWPKTCTKKLLLLPSSFDVYCAQVIILWYGKTVKDKKLDSKFQKDGWKIKGTPFSSALSTKWTKISEK